MMLIPLLALVAAPQVAQVEAVLQTEIGGPGGVPEAVFEHISDLAADADGNVYALDQWADRVRVFSPTGDHVSTWGRRGVTAGELNRPLGIDVQGDTVTILNPSSQVNNYGPDGQTLTSEQLPFGAQATTRTADERYVVLTEGGIAQGNPAPVMSLLVTRTSDVDTLMTVPSSGFFYRGPMATSYRGTTLCRLAHFVVGAEEIWGASGVDGRLTEWHLVDGVPELARTADVAPEGIPLPDSVRTRVLAQVPSQMDPESGELYTPPLLSSICALERSPDGTLWLRLADADGREQWRAIDPATLDPIRELTAPEGIAIRAFSGDLAYGVPANELRVTRMMVYRLQ
jgi:hypothetical protein